MIGCCRSGDEHPLQSENSWNSVTLWNRRPGCMWSQQYPYGWYYFRPNYPGGFNLPNNEDYTQEQWNALYAKMVSVLDSLPFDEFAIPTGYILGTEYRLVTDRRVDVVIDGTNYPSWPVDIQNATVSKIEGTTGGRTNVQVSTQVIPESGQLVPSYERSTAMTKVRYKNFRLATENVLHEVIYRNGVVVSDVTTHPNVHADGYWEGTPWEVWGENKPPFVRCASPDFLTRVNGNVKYIA